MANMQNAMWFGTKNYMQWITPPQINYDSSRVGRVYTAQYTNGGAYVRRSSTGARHYNFSWNLKRRDEIRSIMDYADGVYGDSAIYFLDPFAVDKNLLPQYWATPSLGCDDAPQIYGFGDQERPDKVATGANSIGLPTYSAQFTMATGKKNPTLYIPVPPGYTLWIGAYGTSSGTARLNVIPATGPTTFGAAQVVTLLPVTSSQLVNTAVNGSVNPGAYLQLGGTSGGMVLSGVIAQVWPNGVTPPTNRWISGQGHSGCSFNDNPVLTQYSARIDRVGLSVDLIETEGWR